MKDLIKRLRRFNAWRRGDDPRTFPDLNISPKQIGLDIDAAIRVIENSQCLADIRKDAILVNENYLYELCDAVTQLERRGYKFCVDFGYDNAIEKFNSLTKKAEPPPTRDVNRDSGTDSANSGWLGDL